MQEQTTRKRIDSFQQEFRTKGKYKYDLVEVQHMAGIVPRDIESFTTEEKYSLGHKYNILLYDEAPIEIYDDTTLHDKYVYLDKNDVDYNLFKKQYDFLLSLSDLELNCIHLYTGPGYVEVNFFYQNRNNREIIINRAKKQGGTREKLEKIFNIKPYRESEPSLFSILKNEPFKPTISEEEINNNLYNCYLNFFNTLANIFKKCPKTEKEIRLFRGIQIEKDPGSDFNIVNFYGFNSTTYNPETAFSEDFYNGKCCILDIKVKPGVPVLWVSPLSDKSFTQGKTIFGESGHRDATEKELLFFSDTLVSTISNRQVKTLFRYGDRPQVASNYYTANVYNVIVEPRTSRNLLTSWKTLSNKSKTYDESDAFKGSQQGTSRKTKRKSVRKQRNKRKTTRK